MLHKAEICQAIAERKVISFLYKGVIRRVEPHAYGIAKSGEPTLSAWQLSGGSGQGFRDFLASSISGLTITPDGFAGPRPGYNQFDATMTSIACRL